MISLLKDRCQGCELCIEVCPKKILKLNKDDVNNRGHNPIEIVDIDKCIECALCATMCPDCVIELKG